MQRKLTAEQIRQALLAALEKAAESIRVMPTLSLPDKYRAVETLMQTHIRLKRLGPHEREVSTSALLIYSTKERYAEVQAVLRSNQPIQTLSRFGAVPKVLIAAVFKGKGVLCPVELQSFHAAYQEQLRSICSLPNADTPLSTARPT